MATDPDDDLQEQEDQPSKFPDLFENPTIERLLALTWQEFEAFVQYVFERAGYSVQHVASRPSHHVDLLLFRGPGHVQPVARVECRRYQTARIRRQAVLQFIGALDILSGNRGYIVTTGDFVSGAYEVARQASPQVVLLNGRDFVRYITYVRGSRLAALQPVAHAPLLPNPKGGPFAPSYLTTASAMPRHDPGDTLVLTVANNRGGVGKTTTALNLAVNLAEHHKQRVLVIDLDAQSTLTTALLHSDRNDPETRTTPSDTLPAFFVGAASLPQLVRATEFERLWLIPSHQDLTMLDAGGYGRPEAELAFARAIHDPALLAPDGKPFDWIILDTPPAQSFFTRAALAASHRVLYPAKAEVFAINGAVRAVRTSSTMRALMGGGVEPLACLVICWRGGAAAERDKGKLVDAMNARGVRTSPTPIPEDSKLPGWLGWLTGGWLTRGGHGAPRSGPAAAAYQQFIEEELLHVRSHHAPTQAPQPIAKGG